MNRSRGWTRPATPRVFQDPAAQDDGLVEHEGSDDEPAPQANLGVRTTPSTERCQGVGALDRFDASRPPLPSTSPGRVASASTAQTAWRRRLVTRVSLETSRNDTTCGVRPARPWATVQPTLLIISSFLGGLKGRRRRRAAAQGRPLERRSNCCLVGADCHAGIGWAFRKLARSLPCACECVGLKDIPEPRRAMARVGWVV
jgi:hypothetical protein